MDNIFTNLLGIVPTLDNCLFMQPLIPSNWSYWAFENIPYHGTLLSIVMSDGAHYGLAKGLHIYSNGTLFHSQPTLGASLNLTLPFDTATAAASLAAPLEWQNILANPNCEYSLHATELTETWKHLELIVSQRLGANRTSPLIGHSLLTAISHPGRLGR